ncbi:MAG: hypothetical protein QM533_10485 [Cytophagales bacterium]|nr:hypothetical protein [Cytophagales bacterium]
MNPNPMANAKTADFRNAHAALLRAAEAARATAKQFNVPMVARKSGQAVKLAVK